MSKKLQWRVNTAQLISEIADNNSQMAGLRAPLTIFKGLLIEVGERASQLNDPELNAIMVRLAIYDIGDPYTKQYDKKLVERIINMGEKAKRARLKQEKLKL